MLKFTRTITAIFWLFSATEAMAAQSSVVMPTTNPHPSTGFTMMEFTGTWLNPALQSLLSNNSGTTAPTNGPSNAPMAWEYWIDTSASPATWKIYDGASWVTIGTINATTHLLGIPVTNISGLGAGVAAAAAIATNANGGFPTVSVSATAPSVPSLFQAWLNTTATPYVWNIWDGASWVALGTINATTHAFTSPTLNLAATPSGGFGGVSGILPATSFPALTGDCVTSSGAVSVTCTISANNFPYIATGTGPIARPLSSWLEQFVYVTEFTSDAACATDTTTAIQNAINKASSLANGGTVIFPAGKFCYSSLSITTNNVSLEGQGAATQLLQNSKTANGIQIGDGTHIIDGVSLRQFTMWQQTGASFGPKTGGATILAYYARNLTIDSVNVGSKDLLTAYGSAPLYNGIVVAGFDNVKISNSNIMGSVNDCFTIYAQPNTPQGSPTTDFGTEMHWTGGGQIVQCGRFGIHIGGGAGGVFFESGGEGLAGAWGVYVDRTLDTLASANPQIEFADGFSIDTNVSGGAYLDNTSYQIAAFKGYIGANSGPGIQNHATQDAHALLQTTGAQIYANKSHGVACLGGRCVFDVSTEITYNGQGSGSLGGSGVLCYGVGVTQCSISAFVENNGSLANNYGVDDQANAGATEIEVVADLSNNFSGPYRSINGLGNKSVYSLFAPNQNGAWVTDAGSLSTAIANLGTVNLPVGSGFVSFSINETGETCMFAIGGSQVSLVKSSASAPACSTTVAASNVGITYSAPNYQLFNQAGATRTFVGVTGTRNRSVN